MSRAFDPLLYASSSSSFDPSLIIGEGSGQIKPKG